MNRRGERALQTWGSPHAFAVQAQTRSQFSALKARTQQGQRTVNRSHYDHLIRREARKLRVQGRPCVKAARGTTGGG